MKSLNIIIQTSKSLNSKFQSSNKGMIWNNTKAPLNEDSLKQRNENQNKEKTGISGRSIQRTYVWYLRHKLYSKISVSTKTFQPICITLKRLRRIFFKNRGFCSELGSCRCFRIFVSNKGAVNRWKC